MSRNLLSQFTSTSPSTRTLFTVCAANIIIYLFPVIHLENEARNLDASVRTFIPRHIYQPSPLRSPSFSSPNLPRNRNINISKTYFIYCNFPSFSFSPWVPPDFHFRASHSTRIIVDIAEHFIFDNLMKKKELASSWPFSFSHVIFTQIIVDIAEHFIFYNLMKKELASS